MFSKNKYPKPANQNRLADSSRRYLGEVMIQKERPERQMIDWAEVAKHAQPVYGHDVPINSTIKLNQETQVTKQVGDKTRRLVGIMFAGQQRFGLVEESSKQGSGTTESFLLTSIGEGQKTGTIVASVDIEPQGSVINIGRAGDNEVAIAMDRTVSRHHIELSIAKDILILSDLGSKNGTAYFRSTEAERDDADPIIANAWNQMKENPALWSGEYDGALIRE